MHVHSTVNTVGVLSKGKLTLATKNHALKLFGVDAGDLFGPMEVPPAKRRARCFLSTARCVRFDLLLLANMYTT